MDTVLSNFRNLFAIGSRYYDYSYDLLDIAAYYARFDRLMAFWRAALPGRILELSYEALVADQEGETRRLLSIRRAAHPRAAAPVARAPPAATRPRRRERR